MVFFYPFLMFIYSGVFKSLYVYYGINPIVSFLMYLIVVSYHFLYLYIPVNIYKKLKLDIVWLPFLMVAFECLKSTLFGGMPVGNLNILVYDIPFFIRPSSYFGSYFVTLSLLFLPLSFYLILQKRHIGYFIIAFFAVFMFLPNENIIDSQKETISIVQGNIPQNQKWDRSYLDKNLHIYLKESLKVKSGVVFWPESSYPYLFEEDNNELVGFVKNKKNIALVVGVVRIKNDRYFNSIALIKKNNINYYDKQKLVPFAEFIPYRSILGKFIPKSLDPGDFIKGKRNIILPYKDLKIGAMVCYEEAFSDISRKYKNMGANLLAILTNDAWFDKTPTFYMLHRNAIFRAVENNVWVVRVANTGISEIIAPNGKIYAKLENDTRDVLNRNLIITESLPTFFDRYGYLFCLFLMIFVSLLIFYRIDKLRKGKESNREAI